MPKRIHPGDLFVVPIDDYFVPGLVLHVSKLFSRGMMVGFYDCKFSDYHHIDESNIASNFVWTPNYASITHINKQRWIRIGNYPKLLAQTSIPQLRVANLLYDKDEFIRRLPIEEWKLFTELSGGGCLYYENKLSLHFKDTR